MNSKDFKVGDVIDINQTVNGISKFVLFTDGWHYFESHFQREYEYDQIELCTGDDVDLLYNVFELESKLKEQREEAEELVSKCANLAYQNENELLLQKCRDFLGESKPDNSELTIDDLM